MNPYNMFAPRALYRHWTGHARFIFHNMASHEPQCHAEFVRVIRSLMNQTTFPQPFKDAIVDYAVYTAYKGL